MNGRGRQSNNGPDSHLLSLWENCAKRVTFCDENQTVSRKFYVNNASTYRKKLATKAKTAVIEFSLHNFLAILIIPN